MGPSGKHGEHKWVYPHAARVRVIEEEGGELGELRGACMLCQLFGLAWAPRPCSGNCSGGSPQQVLAPTEAADSAGLRAGPSSPVQDVLWR